MKNFMLFLMTLFLSCHVMAQQTTITGTITDGADGSPLIGANVLVKGTGTGSIADINGNFSVSVPAGKNVLVISCIGYKQQEITLKPGQKVVNVVMKEDSELLDEVVVVGYGTMKRVTFRVLRYLWVKIKLKALSLRILTSLCRDVQPV